MGPADRVFEVVAGSPQITFDVVAVFNSGAAGASCVIEEWGVHVEKIGEVGVGAFLRYSTGGASGERTYGKCVIAAATGDYPISQYVKDGEEGPPPEEFFYLRPGEPVSMEVSIAHPSADKDPGPQQDSPDPSPGPSIENTAVILTIYARVRVKGVTSVVSSKNSFRAIFPQDLAGVPWKAFYWDSSNPDNERFESLRSRCYGTLAELQR